MSDAIPIVPPSKSQAIKRGTYGICPHCGEGKIFSAWYTAHERCPRCGLEFEPSSGATFVFNYIGSAGVTGLLVILMYIIIRPDSMVVQTLLFISMLALLIGTMPQRKGAIIGVDYLMRRDMDEEPMPATLLIANENPAEVQSTDIES